MGDQAERVVLEAEDHVTPITNKANAALDSFERKAAASGDRLARINDQTRNSVQRLIASLEKQADLYGKSGVEKLIVQRDQLLQRYQREPAAIDAITRSYQKMVEVQTKADLAAAEAERKREEAERKRLQAQAEAQRRGTVQSSLGYARDPMGGLMTGAESALQYVGPLGSAVAIGTAAMAAMSAVTYEAAKSLGAYAVQVRDVELRTGLTAHEVGQFGFAARAVGQDIGIMDRAMRGLTVAVEDNSEKGLKGQEWLRRFGVDIGAVRNGTASTSQVVLKLSEGLNNLTTEWERNKAALDIFNRAGIELIPFLVELRENVEYFEQHHLPAPTDEENKRWEEYNRRAAAFQTIWESFTRRVNQGLVNTAFLSTLPLQLLLNPETQMPGPTSMGHGGPHPLEVQRKADEDRALDMAAKVHAERLNEGAAVAQMRKDYEAIVALEEKEFQLKREGQQFYQIGTGPSAQIVTGSQIFQANQPVRRAPSLFANPAMGPEGQLAVAQAVQQWMPRDMQQGMQFVGGEWSFISPESSRVGAAAGEEAGNAAQLNARWAGQMDIWKRGDQARVAAVAAETNHRIRLLEIEQEGADAREKELSTRQRIVATREREIVVAQDVADIREAGLKAELAITGEVVKYREESYKNQLTLQANLAEAEQRSADAAIESQQKEIEAVKRSADKLFEDLFTHPSRFGADLLAEVRNAALTPLIKEMSSLTAKAVAGLLPHFAEGGITTGPTIAGEAGPELVIPLSRLSSLKSGQPYYGPARDPALTDAALAKVAGAGIDIGIPLGLAGLGGPVGISVGESLMSLFVGGVAAATPPRRDNLQMGAIPKAGDLEPYYTARWVINPETGEIITSKIGRIYADGDLLPEHHEMMAAHGWPTAGRAYDMVHRGQASLARDGRILSLGDQSAGGVEEFLETYGASALHMFRPITESQAAGLEGHITELFGRGPSTFARRRSASIRAPRDLEYMVAPRSVNPELPEFLFNKTQQDMQAIGAKGGRARVRNLRLKQAAMTPEELEAREYSDAIYVGRDPDPLETAHEARAKIDALFPHLAGTFEKTDAQRLNQRTGRAGGRIGGGLNRLPGSEIPQYDQGGTVASTGMAVVHQGEAVVPQADSLKRSIDALTSAMVGTSGTLCWLISTLAGGGAGGGSTVAMAGQIVGTGVTPSSSGGGAAGGGGGLYDLPTRRSPFVTNPLGVLLGGGGGAAGGRAGGGAPNLSSLISDFKAKNIQFGGITRSPARGVNPGDDSGYYQTRAGHITGVSGLAGAGLQMGGSMLASQGLLGSSRGTGLGIAEGTAGGAMIGFQMGGPLGAAIGGAAGAIIGTSELLLGMQSPQVKAHNQIKSIYGVDIPQNSGTIKQVVSMAQSNFGGDIAVAVRSPSVRQLVMLYSESTGQHMPLSATTPYAGSLVEQGGKLYQQATYQDGQAHTYASSLPTLAGIGAGSTYPMQGGPNTSSGTGTNVTINLNGQPITSDFVADQYGAAQNASYGRTQQSANMQVPGLMVG